MINATLNPNGSRCCVCRAAQRSVIVPPTYYKDMSNPYLSKGYMNLPSRNSYPQKKSFSAAIHFRMLICTLNICLNVLSKTATEMNR